MTILNIHRHLFSIRKGCGCNKVYLSLQSRDTVNLNVLKERVILETIRICIEEIVLNYSLKKEELERY